MSGEELPQPPARWLRGQGAGYPLKRLLDIVVVIIAMPAVAILAGPVALAILLSSGRPVLYRARRVGQDGRAFTMYKFRTMVPDADAKLPSLATRNLATGMVKIPNDPRVTPIGRWLRRFSLDELPQLWNVLRGQMSIVGPRPHEVRERSELPPHDFRLRMRPGVTGLWQLRARSEPSLSTRIYWDWQYVSRCSLWLDLTLMAQTLPALMRGRGGCVEGGALEGSTVESGAEGSTVAVNEATATSDRFD